MSKPSVIIIGAGATGLIAAKELSAEFKVTVLEAQSHNGGRIHSIEQQGNIIEAGAEFVHGNLPVTLGILKEAGIPYVEVEGKMYRKKNGKFSTVHEMAQGWDGLLEKMKTITEDITIQQLLDKYYTSEKDEPLRKQIQSYSEGFDLADISRVSVKSLYREWSLEDEENYRIPSGYGNLLEYLQKMATKQGVIFCNNAAVKSVQWLPGAVTVFTAGEEKYTAEKLLVTVPVSLLQQPASKAHIHFTPHIHFNQHQAADIGFGTVIKVVFKFKKPFWQRDAGFILSDEVFPTWWTRLPHDIPIITGWMGGPKAAAYSDETDDAIIEKALDSLSSIYDLPLSELKNDLELSMVFNWQKNQYAMGAYSYDTIRSDAARDMINTPLANTIFFAGEALYSGDHPGTVEAAFVSGIHTSDLIKRGMSI